MKVSFFTLPILLSAATFSSAHALGDIKKEEFIKKASQANLFEIESSKLALEKAATPEVKDFAEQMIKDHTKAGNDLKEAVSKAKADKNQIATILDEDNQQKIKKLSEQSGKDFDESYLEMQKKAHYQAVNLFEEYAEKADSEELKTFADNTLPVLKQHQQHVDRLD